MDSRASVGLQAGRSPVALAAGAARPARFASRAARVAAPRRVGLSVPRHVPPPSRSRPFLPPRSAAFDGGSAGGGEGGGKGSGSGGGGGGGGGGGKGDDASDADGSSDGDSFLSLSAALSAAAAAGVALPAEYARAASEQGGLRASVLAAYFALAKSGNPVVRFLAGAVPAFRDRLVADRRFFFKVFAEVAIDSGCATVAEVRKRGKDFWDEFELYLSDLVVGLVLDVVLVTLLAPVAVPGRRARAATSPWARATARLPSAAFEASVPGRPRYSLLSRLGCVAAKFVEYGIAGTVCGFVGQGTANAIISAKNAKRAAGAERAGDDGAAAAPPPPPPLVRTALVWGLFMGVSSNLRYQAVFGLEALVDALVGRRLPPLAYGATVGLRFANNVIGGEQFVDMARYFGAQ